MFVRSVGDARRNFIPLTRIEVAPFISAREDDALTLVAPERDARAIEVVAARRNDNAGSDLERLGQDIRHVLDGAEEEVGGVLELRIPRKLRLSRRELAPPVRVVFELRLELHLAHVWDELRARLIGGLPEILMKAR